jgi:hypothetical protein
MFTYHLKYVVVPAVLVVVVVVVVIVLILVFKFVNMAVDLILSFNNKILFSRKGNEWM